MEASVELAEEATLDLLRWEQQIFPSSALGCPEPGFVYADVETDGYALWLSAGEAEYEVHTDLGGNQAALCAAAESGGKGEGGEANQQQTELELYDSEQLHFSIRYPAGWWVEANPVSGQAIFHPGNNSPLHGMVVQRQDPAAVDPFGWLAELSDDPEAAPEGGRQLVGTEGQSQVFRRMRNGEPVLERVTAYPAGVQVRQWAPAGEWPEWEVRFLQMLDSLVID